MITSLIQVVGAAETTDAVRVVTRAFASDPVARWLYPAQGDYERYFPELVRALGGQAFAHRTAYCDDGFAGAALWLPPRVDPDEERLVELVGETVPAARHDEVFGMFEQMGQWHPTASHWYLPLIGVTPQAQGRGLGTALLRHSLTACDEAGLPAYLEATTRRNAALYARCGFEVVGEIQAGTSPAMLPMVRPPRAGVGG